MNQNYVTVILCINAAIDSGSETVSGITKILFFSVVHIHERNTVYIALISDELLKFVRPCLAASSFSRPTLSTLRLYTV